MATYDYYFAALRFHAGEGPKPDAHFNEPQPGFYRTLDKSGVWLPVAIWEDEGVLVAQKAKKPRDATTPFEMIDVAADEIWDFVVGKEVPEETWRRVCDRSEAWPDEAPGFGHNEAPLDKDPLVRIDQVLENADKFLAVEIISSKPKADAAAEFIAELLDLKGILEEAEKEEKAEASQEIKDISAKFKPKLKAAEKTIAKIRDELTAYMLKAEVDRVGARRRAVTLRKTTVPVIEDFGKALQHFAADEKIREALEKLIAAEIKAGKTIPGVTTKEERKAV
ncbi:siphovirus Gp157 family protein [Microvirga sp. Mcv34]|uniref:siphovirus Gp157 family protein n=1 Tax=Microvirga sp. Mcv34 TaxID=2926016 RepID=UPI0021C9E2B0|nr:siphovirus Gp157 family protein [Microvirga sp. Mcv34]